MIQNFQDEICFVLDTMKGIINRKCNLKVLWVYVLETCILNFFFYAFSAETNDGYHIILKWKLKLKEDMAILLAYLFKVSTGSY